MLAAHLHGSVPVRRSFITAPQFLDISLQMYSNLYTHLKAVSNTPTQQKFTKYNYKTLCDTKSTQQLFRNSSKWTFWMLWSWCIYHQQEMLTIPIYSQLLIDPSSPLPTFITLLLPHKAFIVCWWLIKLLFYFLLLWPPADGCCKLASCSQSQN